MTGKKLSEESRRKMSAVRTGKRHTDETRARMSASKQRGPEHPQWKGDAIAYSTIHTWINRVAVKTGSCSRCGAERTTHWANLSHTYRRDVSDFAEMCVPCHWRYDRGLL
jgi:hypothetical protein